jgi:hypothetical protein
MNRTSENTTGYRTFQATAVAIAAGARVAVDSNGLISVSGAANDSIGVTVEVVAASGYGTVKLWSAPGTFQVLAGAAITRGAALYPIASGKVDDVGTTGGALGLVALEAATADGDIIEAGPINNACGPTLGDGQNIAIGTTTGTKIGTGTTQKIGFYNATAVVQPASANQAALGAATTVGSNTGTAGAGLSLIGATNTGDRSGEIMNDFRALQEDVAAITTLVNQLRSELVTLGLIKGSA